MARGAKSSFGQAQQGLFHCFVRFAEALIHAILNQHQPLLLFLDDIQWCDRETLKWLHALLRFNPQAQLLLICTMRTEEIIATRELTPLFANLRRDGLLTEVVPAPLNTEETAHLAVHLTGKTLATSIISSLYQETEGNPLFVVETVRAGSIEKMKNSQFNPVRSKPTSRG